MNLSIIVSTYNSEEHIEEFAFSLFAALSDVERSVEFVFVDDKSADKTWDKLVKIKASNEMLDIKLLGLCENYGQLAATTCGFKNAKYDLVVTIDDDLKHSPLDIGALYQFFIVKNYLLVFGADAAKQPTGLKAVYYSIVKYLLFPKFRNTLFSSFRVFNRKNMEERFKNDFIPWNLHALWKFKAVEIGNVQVAESIRRNSKTRYTALSLMQHQRLLLLHIIVRISLIVEMGLVILLANTNNNFRFYVYNAFVAFGILLFVSLVLNKKWNKVNYIVHKQL